MGDLLIAEQVLHIHPTWRYDFLEVGLVSSGPFPNLAHIDTILVPHLSHIGRILPAMLRARTAPV